MSGLEVLDDRDVGRRLGLVAFEAADLQRKTTPVHEQTDNDLGVDPAFLGIVPLPQFVFLLGLEIQGGDA
jgi:hypothetical protein